MLQQSCHFLEALTFGGKYAGPADQGANPLDGLKIVPSSEEDGGCSEALCQGGCHLAESLRMPCPGGLRGSWMQGDAKRPLKDPVPSEETDGGISGLRGKVVAEPAIGCVGAQGLDEFEEVVHVVPLHRKRKGIRQEPASQITLKSHPAGDARHAREHCCFKSLLEEKRQVESLLPQLLDQFPPSDP